MLRIDDYILALPSQKREMYTLLRDVINETVPGVKEKIAYGIPFFHLKKPFCYLHQHNDGVDLSFPSGHLFAEKFPEMDKRNRKLVRTLHYQKVEDINLGLLQEVLIEAAKLDRGWKK